MRMEKQAKKYNFQKVVLVLIGLAVLVFIATHNISSSPTTTTGTTSTEQPVKIKMNNDTPEGAAMMFINACVEDDTKAMDKINKSDSFNFPTPYIMDIAAKKQMGTYRMSDFSFSQVEKSGYEETTKFVKVDGPVEWNLKMVMMNGKWYFDRLGSY